MKNTKTYCVMCCENLPHSDNGNNELACDICMSPASDGILERDEQIENLAYENLKMSEELLSLGYSQDEISCVCSGMPKENPSLITPKIKNLD